MIVTNFPSRQSLEYYMNKKLSEFAIPVTSQIQAIIVNKNLSLLLSFLDQCPEEQDKISYYNNNIDLFNNLVSSNYPNVSEFNAHPAYLFYTPEKKTFENIFKDIISPLQTVFFYYFENYIRELNPSFTLCNLNYYSNGESSTSFYDNYDKIIVEDINYSAYFKDIKNIISRIHSENKFYIKHIDILQAEVVDLRRQVSDLTEQLNIKTFSTWS